MKRYILIVLAMCMLFLTCAGCGRRGVDPDVKPEMYFSQFREFTDLYGKERMAALDVLGVDLQEVENISDNRWGINRRESYAGMEFEISAIFRGKENLFSGVYMERTYQFPEEKDDLIMDAVAVCKQLNADFGVATDNSYFFNWVSMMMGEDWNRDIKFWQDPFVIKRVVDENYAGTLLAWDLTPVASTAIKQHLGDTRHGLACSLHINESDGEAYLTITY